MIFACTNSRRQQHPDILAADRLDVHRLVQPDPHHLCDAAGVVAIGLADVRREGGLICRVSTQITGNRCRAIATAASSPTRL